VTSVRSIAEEFGRRFGKKPVLQGQEAPDAWLVNVAEANRLFGEPRVPMSRMIDWTADWVARCAKSCSRRMANCSRPAAACRFRREEFDFTGRRNRVPFN